jgi:hypothetical protein
VHRRNLPVIVVIAVAALLSAAMSLGAMTTGSRTTAAPGPAQGAHHGATEAQVRFRVVRRCRMVPVRRAGKVVRRRGKVVRRRVCKRVRVRIPVRVATTPTSPTTTPAGPGTTNSVTVTAPVTTTAPAAPELVVREFAEGGAFDFRLTLSATSVPAGTYTVRRRVETAIEHNLDIRPTGAAAATVVFPLLGASEDSGTVVLTPGSWTFRCTVPGHSAMTATLTVTP